METQNKPSSKQEAINKVYGIESLRADANGWMLLGYLVPNDLGFSEDEIDRDETRGIWRPKSLQGIENNLGWIKIEDLKLTKPTICFVVNEFSEVDIDTYRNDIEEYFKSSYTHYQPIIKPNPPIY